MKILKALALPILLSLLVSSCQKEQVAPAELCSNTEEQIESTNSIGVENRELHEIRVTSNSLTVGNVLFENILGWIKTSGFTIVNKDCEVVHTVNSTTNSNWESALYNSLEILEWIPQDGDLEDIITFRLVDLKLLSYDCSMPGFEDAICDELYEHLHVFSPGRRGCFLGLFFLDGTEYVDINLDSYVDKKACRRMQCPK